jgi:hypothetical protein
MLLADCYVDWSLNIFVTGSPEIHSALLKRTQKSDEGKFGE